MENFKNIAQAMQFLPDKMKKNGLFETERRCSDRYVVELGQTQALHVHESSDKIYFVVHGKALVQIGDSEKELGQNEIALAASGQRHGVKNPGPDRLMLLVFMAPKPSH